MSNKSKTSLSAKWVLNVCISIVVFFPAFTHADESFHAINHVDRLIALEEHQLHVPYGVYVIRNKWGCDLKDPRCDLDLYIPRMPEVTLDKLSSRWEIIPLDSSDTVHHRDLFKIRSLDGCDIEPKQDSCEAHLSHQNGVVQLDKDTSTVWRITRCPTTFNWKIKSETVLSDGTLKEQIVSISPEFDHPQLVLVDDDNVMFELLLDLDFVDSQSLGEVQFDLRAEDFVTGGEELTLATDEVHNLGDEEVQSTVAIKFEVSEGRKFTDWDGFVLPVETLMEMQYPIFNGQSLQLTEELVSYKTVWRHQSFKRSENEQLKEMKVPALTYKMIAIRGIEANYSLPFNGKVTQKYTTGKSSVQTVRGLYYTSQIYSIHMEIGSPISLAESVIAENGGHHANGVRNESYFEYIVNKHHRDRTEATNEVNEKEEPESNSIEKSVNTSELDEEEKLQPESVVIESHFDGGNLEGKTSTEATSSTETSNTTVSEINVQLALESQEDEQLIPEDASNEKLTKPNF